MSSILIQSLCRDGKIGLYGFLGSLVPGLLVLTANLLTTSCRDTFNQLWPVLFLASFLIVQILTYLGYRSPDHDYQIIWRSTLLGSIFGLSFAYSLLVPVYWRPLFIFLAVLSLFHFSEYLVTAITKPRALKLSSFLLDHSVAYHTALILALGEYLIELHLLPGLKTFKILVLLGLSICLVGDSIRKMAMLTARSNFDHTIQTRKNRDHVLVTHGIYSWSRHPAYVGWFWWAIGTQILLVNPVCLVIYIVLSWKFFSERVYEEEMLLVNFFGLEYVEYQRKVSTRLPFIKGYLLGE